MEIIGAYYYVNVLSITLISGLNQLVAIFVIRYTGIKRLDKADAKAAILFADRKPGFGIFL
jgi:hypothetical protein